MKTAKKRTKRARARSPFVQRKIQKAVLDALRIAEATLFNLTKDVGVSIAVQHAYNQIAPLAFALVPGLSEQEDRCIWDHIELEPGSAVYSGRGPHWAMYYIARSLADTMSEAPNYMTATLTTVAAHGPRFEVLVRQIGKGKTAHELRAEAEARVKELEAELAQRGIVLPGWSCPACSAFNGEAKERREACRACDAPRPAPP